MLGRSRLRNAVQSTVVRTILRFHRSRLAMAERISGIGVRYPRRGHPWTGRCMPDVDCAGTRLYELLRDGRFVLVSREPVDGAVHAPALTGPAAGLVRPDGYVGWASDRTPTAAEAADALAEWSTAARDTGRRASL